MSKRSPEEHPRVLLSAGQIDMRVQEMARQISQDYRGQTIYAVCRISPPVVGQFDPLRCVRV